MMSTPYNFQVGDKVMTCKKTPGVSLLRVPIGTVGTVKETWITDDLARGYLVSLTITYEDIGPRQIDLEYVEGELSPAPEIVKTYTTHTISFQPSPTTHTEPKFKNGDMVLALNFTDPQIGEIVGEGLYAAGTSQDATYYYDVQVWDEVNLAFRHYVIDENFIGKV